MNQLCPMYRVAPTDTASADLTDGRVFLRLGGVTGLTLLFDSAADAEAAVDQWAHDLRTQTVAT